MDNEFFDPYKKWNTYFIHMKNVLLWVDDRNRDAERKKNKALNKAFGLLTSVYNNHYKI